MPVDIASGTVSLVYHDVAIPGKVDLVWDRCYSTGLIDTKPGLLGLGWTCRYSATLAERNGEFRFTTPEGSAEVFDDSDGTVRRGGTLRNFGAFSELFKRGSHYVVQRWNIDTGQVLRFCFVPTAAGVDWPLVSIEDPTGQALDLAWDGLGRLLRIQQRLERRLLVFRYTPAGLIDSVVHRGHMGQEQVLARYEYDQNDRQIVAYDAADLADHYAYDDAGRLVREVVKDGGVFTYRYDKKGRCVRTSGLDRYQEKTLRYFDAFRFTEVIDSYGRKYGYHYLPSGQIVRQIGPIGNQNSTAYDDYGRIVVRTDAIGGVTAFSYDEYGNRASMTDALGDTRTFAYNKHHLLTSATSPRGGVWQRLYDDVNRVVGTVDAVGNSWRIQYDAEGNVAAIENPTGATKRQSFRHGVLESATDWLGHVTRFRVDEFGRIVAREGPLGDMSRFGYDRVGNPVEVRLPNGTTLKSTYDSVGNLTSFTDGNGQTTHFRFGPCGRLLERVDPTGGVVRYVWGTEPDWLTSVVNENGEVYNFFRDEGGRIVREVSFDGAERSFQYDAEGYLIAYTNACGEAIYNQRDPLHRVTAQTLPSGERVTFAFDSDGNLVGAVNDDTPVVLERDLLGRVVREVQGETWVESDYDSLGNRTRLLTSLGHQVYYEVDANGFVSRLRTEQSQEVAFERNAYGQEKSRWMVGAAVMELEYDDVGRIVEQRVISDPTANASSRNASTPSRRSGFVSHIYAYDGNGSVTSIADERWGRVDYSYDPADRLLQAVREGGSTQRFAHDPAGNLTLVQTQDDVSPAATMVHGAGNRLLRMGSTLFEYDAEGRRLRRIEDIDSAHPQVWQYSWDALDRLRTLTKPDGDVWRYKYDALARRVEKTGPISRCRFIWDKNTVVQETAEATPTSAWIFDPYSFAPWATVQDARVFCVITDHLGTPTELIDSAGRVAWSMTYEAYGREAGRGRDYPGRVDCPIRFQGQWYDAESGSHYNRHRYYDPACGQFISQDPIGLAGGFNLYEYVPNPISWIDPLGLACGPAVRRNSRGQWIDANGKFANTPPAPNFVAESARHEAGIPGTTRGYHAAGSPNPTNGAGVVAPKSKFGPGEGGAPFSAEVYNHPQVQATQQGNGRWSYQTADMNRDTGTNQAGGTVRGGQVIVEGTPAANPAVYNPGEVVTQYPR